MSDVPSALRFLVEVFSFVVHAEFEVGILQRIFILQTTDFHFANYRFSFRTLQIFISQTTDFHFANNRFSFRKTTDFHFVSFHFVSFRFVSLHFVSQTTVSRVTGNAFKWIMCTMVTLKLRRLSFLSCFRLKASLTEYRLWKLPSK